MSDKENLHSNQQLRMVLTSTCEVQGKQTIYRLKALCTSLFNFVMICLLPSGHARAVQNVQNFEGDILAR